MATICYVGKRQSPTSKNNGPFGISVCEYDPETGALTELECIAPKLCVGCLTVSDGVLYATDEVKEHPAFEIGGGGRVFAYAIDPATGRLSPLGDKPTYGTMPAYVSRAGRSVLVANHGSRRSFATRVIKGEDGVIRAEVCLDDASIVLYHCAEDGSIGRAVDVWKAQGRGGRPVFQSGPHMHSIVPSPDGTLFAGCDKGTDRVHLFRVEGDNLVCTDSCQMQAGYAPRYPVFHPTKTLLYVNNEYEPYIDTLRYTRDGKLTRLSQMYIFPEEMEVPDCDEKTIHGQSDIKINRAGTRIYELFREIDCILVFSVDPETGALTRMQVRQTEGVKKLRSLLLSPDEKHLLVAAIDSSDLLVYDVREDGTLGDLAFQMDVMGVAHLAFFETKEMGS